jgi:hypothetical protein
MAPPLRRAKTEAAKKKAKASKSESMPERGDFRLHQSDTNRPLAQNLTRPAWAVPLKLDCSPAYCNCTVRRIESFAEPAPHIQELSFSHSGRAFEHPPGFDNGPIFLNARPINSKACKRILQAEPPEDCPKLRVSISLTEKEKQQNPPPGASKYLLVGWVLPDFKAKDGKAGHGAIVGNQRPPEDEITVFDADDTDNIPLMAVVEVTNDQDETKTSTYVLLHQQDDLCTPYIVGADEVYYLPLFRDNTTAKISRKRNWNIMVAKHSVVPSDEIEMTKQPALQCTRDQAKLVLPPTESIRNEMMALAAIYY